MRVSDSLKAQRLSADEAYQRFFDGYYNLGCPGEVFVGTLVLSPQPAIESPKRRSTKRSRAALRRRVARKRR